MLSLRDRIIWSIITTAMLISSIVAVYAVTETRKIIEKEAYAKLLNYVEKYGADVNQQLDEVEKNTRYMNLLVSRNFSLQRLKNEKGYMEKFKASIAPSVEMLAEQASISKSAYVFFRPELENKPNDVWFSDLNTGKVARQEQFPMDYYNGDRVRLEWYYHPIDTGLAGWTSVYIGTVPADKDVTYTSYTMPVKVDGKIVGVAGSDYYFDRLVRNISSIELYKTGYAFLTDKNFKILTHPAMPMGTELRTAFKGVYAPMIERASKKDMGIEEYVWVDGRVKLLVYTKLDNGWYLAAAPYKDEVFADADKLQTRMYMVLALGMLFTALIGYKLGVFLTRPVTHLTSITQAIGDGNYELEMDSEYLERNDEIGTLSKSIETMRHRQKDSFDQIRVYNSELEVLVMDKTEALKRTNEDLEQSLAQLEEQHAELTEVNHKLGISYETIVNTQKRLLESEKIAALGYLVNGVAHEVNTPVGNCITLSTHMEEETRKVKSAMGNQKMKKTELQGFLDDMEASSHHLFKNLNATMNVISRFKELAAEKTQISKVVFSPKEYVQLVISGMQTELDDKHIKVVVGCHDQLTVAGDPLKFSQILSNLLSNSLYHAFDGIKEGHVDVILEVEGRDLLLTVRDNGRGIEEENLKNIFVPFFSTKFSNVNKGLGLSVVYNIVHQVYEGEIQVKSSIEKGTEVLVTMRNVAEVKNKEV